MRRRTHIRRKGGALSGGIVLMVVAAIVAAFTWLFFPRLPGYDETMAAGTAYPGEVTAVEEDTTTKINGAHPRRARFRYADGKEGAMLVAMDETVAPGQTVTVREWDGRAYPEGLLPLRPPRLLRWAAPALGLLGAFSFALGILRLIVRGGRLLAGR